ncbi:cysteine-rich venom protein TEL1-like [Hyposmocoma kahamanoa]|uniref:cysteine-rich venom protein TEL1-like n=1 Tax=Hyposmocoma kahamanoa TaxID=1477025 RepID=UPI000E6D9CC6|nr:cysteine-rich venom protein TEL1-like [Hyposmocoma kahamanoa]
MHALSFLQRVLTYFFFYVLVDTKETHIWENYISKEPVFSSRELYPHLNKEVQKKIVQYHNYFRRAVRPSASNMLEMTWSEEAASLAQLHASRCEFIEHSRARFRTIPNYGQCGENLFASKAVSQWYTGIESWFSEYEMYRYGSSSMQRLYEEIGHYTQMVWATTHKVGCGMEYCKGGPWEDYYLYICHYCPGGNQMVEFPYKVGPPCADCPSDCNLSLCTNSCSRQDYYGNCDQLVPDACNEGVCNATCECTGKLYKNYPWKYST